MRADLAARRRLRGHSFGLGTACFLAAWAVSAALMHAGVQPLALGLFGIEVLLGVAVEIAFASAGGALAYRARREGWLAHALTRTAWPLVALLMLVALLGGVVDVWLPGADSLPQAVRLLRLLWA